MPFIFFCSNLARLGMVESIVTRRSRKELGVGLLFFKVAVAVRIQIWSSAKWLSQCGLSLQSSSQWSFESSQCGLSSQSSSQSSFESSQFGLSSQSSSQWRFESSQFGLSSQSCSQWRFESSEFVHPCLGPLNLMTCFGQIWYVVVSTLGGVSPKKRKKRLSCCSSMSASQGLNPWQRDVNAVLCFFCSFRPEWNFQGDGYFGGGRWGLFFSMHHDSHNCISHSVLTVIQVVIESDLFLQVL